jgi:hypothetical protein
MSARASTRRIASAACALCACWLIGCSNDERPPAEPAPVAPPAAAKAPAPAPAEPQDPTADELPLQEDFEVEAEQQINDGNFKAELDAIEKEMDAEK